MRFRVRLTEDIESMKKYYPNIPDDTFMNLIKLDPTYKKGSTSAGKYARWILGLADKDKLDNLGHIKDLLTRFESEKKNLINKDIMKYKSVEEVENALNSTENQAELTDRQKERRLRSDLSDAELVAEDANWEVWIPHSHAASCTLGKGTSWCTAHSGSDFYYNHYSKDDDLIIFINKHDPKEKYQYHNKTDSFMNAADNRRDFYLFTKERLSDSIKDYLKNKYPSLKPLIDFDGTWIYDGKQPVPQAVSRYVKKAIIPDDIKSIGGGVFYGCKGLKSVTIPDSVTSIGDNAFSGCSSLTSITIPDSVMRIGIAAFSGCNRLANIIIPNSVTSIGAGAFSGCTELTNVKIGKGVTSIGDDTFSICYGLKSITIPDSVTSIGNYAFYGCDGLTSVTIGNSVTSIGDNAFTACKGFTSVAIPDSVTLIGSAAFFDCSGLTSISIPDSVTRIGSTTFSGCTRLTSIIYTGTKSQWENLRKYGGWNANTGNYTIHCKDGDIHKEVKENFTMKFKTRLTEDIDSMRKYYPNISDEDFMSYIELDPTYKKGSKNPGNYAKWILALVTRNKGTLPDEGHIEDILRRFEENKNNLKDKNISRFKSVQELEDYLNDESSYKELSSRQQLRQTQKAVRNTAIEKDAELVYMDRDWEVWVPKTYEASCKLGQGSEWCTASTSNDYYYNWYTSKGPLYINISRSNPEDKYQFHFETGSFMDADDNSVRLDAIFETYPKLEEFYRPKITKMLFGEELGPGEIKDLAIPVSELDVIGDMDSAALKDPYEVADDWFYLAYSDIRDFLQYAPFSSETSEKLVEMTGMDAEDVCSLLKYKDEDNEYYEDLEDSAVEAYRQASMVGAAIDFQDAVIGGIQRCLPHLKLSGFNSDQLIFSGTLQDFMKDIDIDYTENMVENIVDKLQSDYKRHDPYDEYASSFNDNTFNEVFLSEFIERRGK